MSSAYSELNPIADAELTINPTTNRFWASRPMHVFAAYAGCVSMARARLYTPWSVPSHIRPVSNSPMPPSVPPLSTWLNNPVDVPATHEIIVDAVHTNAAAQNTLAVMMMTTEGLTPRPNGPVQVLRGDVTGATTITRQWSEITVVWEAALPPGIYAIIGSEVISTNAVAHRWILEGSNWRPGGLSQAALDRIPSTYQLNGVLGNWGEFSAPLMPRLEVLCNVADAAHTVFLHVVRVG